MNHGLKYLLSVGTALALLPAATVAATSESQPMQDSNTTTVSSPLATLHVTVAFDRQQQKLAIVWKLDNTGKQALAVFDRGTTLQWNRRPLDAGQVADVMREEDGGTMVLSHRAEALSDPAPTVPPIPLAGRVGAGASRKADFDVDLLKMPSKVRYCLGVTPFDEDGFTPAEKAGDGTWRASFKVVGKQTLLCTPPYDVDSGRFEQAPDDADPA